MAQDDFKPKGRAKASKPDAGGGAIRSEPVFGVVKDNIDPTRSGRLQVYISDFGAPNPDDSSSWVTVGYMSPFYGRTTPSGPQTGFGDYVSNPHSYGMWNSPPDLGTTVICIFINGDMNYGYWIGCVPEAEALTMVPAIGAVDKIVPNAGEAESLGGATQVPVTNINTDNASVSDGAGYINAPKPVHSFQASIFSQQGLIRDDIRGPISSSAQRETPSRVGWGVSTPGRPIYKGGFTDDTIAKNVGAANSDKLTVVARRGGHSIVMDDGDLIGQDQLIRIRSALGHQILMSDDGQTLFIIHSNGQSFIELGKEGTIDMYATNSVNIRTQGDLNLHADRNININAAKDLSISADNINVNTSNNYSQLVGANFKNYVQGTYGTKVDGTMSMEAGGDASYASSSTTYINGAIVNLNTGSTSAPPDVVKPIPLVAHTDTLFDKSKGWAAAPGKLTSIVSRAPAHAPWAGANQGVDVQVSNNADDALPSAPSADLAKANATVAGPVANPTSISLASTVPGMSAISGALDKNVTGALVSSVATQAAALSTAAVTTGLGTITDATGNLTAAVGKLAQTPQQLEISGVIKPGAAALVNSLVQGGSNVQAAMTDNLFTGKPGLENLTNVVNNVAGQVSSQISNFQNAASGLIKTGIISGTEAPSQIAGVISAAAQTSVAQVTDLVKGVSSSVTGALGAVGSLGGLASGVSGALGGLASGISGVGDKLTAAMNGGTFAANMATNLTGGLGSLATSLNGLKLGSLPGLASVSAGLSSLVDSAKGLSGAAFGAITKSFKALQAGVPQNLAEINKKNKEDAAKQEANSLPGVGGLLASAQAALPAGIGGALTSATGALSSVTSAATGALSSVTSAATGALSSVTGSLSSVASGVDNLPGGMGAVSTLVNGTTGSSSIPGISDLSSVVNNVGTGALNNITSASATLSTVAGIGASIGGAGGISSALGGITGAASGISSALGGITGALNGGLGGLASKITAGTQSLTSLISSGLSAGAAAQLAASVNSLSSVSSLQIKLPVVAENTNNRSELLSQVTSILGNSKIPPPNFTGTGPPTSVKDLEAKRKELIDKRDAQGTVVDDCASSYKNLKETLPQGDPALQAAQETWKAELTKYSAISKELKDFLLSQLG